MHYIAQANFAQWKDNLLPEHAAKFLEYADQINASSEQHPGLVWQYPGMFWNDQNVIAEFGNPRIILNISVWKTLDDLRDFVYQSIHSQAMKNRTLWFDSIQQQTYVLWWVKPGFYPDIAEAKQKFELLTKSGPSSQAFNFRTHFECP
jgi:hypothetical protein